MIIQLIQYGPALAGLLLAVCVWFVQGRSHVSLPIPVRTSTVIGMVIVLALMVTYRTWAVWPWWSPPVGEDGYLYIRLLSFAMPLILSMVALVLLFPVGRSTAPRGTAELAPRTPLTFARRGSLISAAVVLALVIVVSVSAGLASTPDSEGRYLVFGVEASANSGGSTTIYGWWYSIPCLVAMAVLVALTVVELVVISRRPVAVDRLSDSRIRTTRVRNIVAVVTGGLLLHLGAVLMSLYGTSSLRLGFQTDPAGWVSLGTSFAAIGPALLVASYIAITVGFACWFAVLLSTVPAPFRRLSGSVRR